MKTQETLPEIKPRLVVRVEEDLSRLKLILENADKAELVGVIEAPRLLWDPVTIKGFERREDITAAFGEQTVIEFDGVSIVWEKGVWPPSIDSLFCAKILKLSGYCSRRIRSVHDIGSGTGFLGIFLVKNNPNIQELYSTDLSDKAVFWTKENAKINHITSKLRTFQTDFTKSYSFPFVELAVSAPPYVPPLTGSDFHPSYADIGFLRIVLRRAREISPELVLVYSNLVEPIIREEAQGMLHSEVLGALEVPFRVPHVLKNPDWLDFLVKKHELEDRGNNGEGYRFWHTVKVARFTPLYMLKTYEKGS